MSARKTYHPFTKIRADKLKDKDAEAKLEICMEYLEENDLRCRRFKNNRDQSPFYNCNCLDVLKDKKDEYGTTIESREFQRECVASYMCSFLDRSTEEKQRTIMEWIRYTDNNSDEHYRYIIPFNNVSKEDVIASDYNVKAVTDLQRLRVCRSAIGSILDFRYHKWKTMASAVETNTMPSHGNKYQRGGRGKQFDKLCASSLHAYFDELKEFAQPESTRVVREETGTGLRDGEEGVYELPSHFSKRTCFVRWCDEQGWIMNLQPRGNYEPEMKQGVDHDSNAFEVKPICALSTFLMFWKKNYPHLRLKKPAEDVCTYCYQFHHKFRYIRRCEAEQNKAAAYCGEDDDDDDITSPHNNSIQCYYIDSNTKSKTNISNDTVIPEEIRPVNYSVPAIVGVREDLIVHAALHVQPSHMLPTYL